MTIEKALVIQQLENWYQKLRKIIPEKPYTNLELSLHLDLEEIESIEETIEEIQSLLNLLKND